VTLTENLALKVLIIIKIYLTINHSSND